jgi:aspartokinase-like uncharacterized kinase
MTGRTVPTARADAAPASAPRPIVVKLGGSVVRSRELPAWLDAIAASPDQLAWAVAGLRAGFEVGDTEHALRRSVAGGRVAVWAPYTLVAGRRDIPESWTVTSDSLALWLARRLDAERCFIVKSVRRKRAALGAAGLARGGVVDAAFPDMLKGAGLPVFLLGRGDQEAFAASLAAPEDCACGATID